MGNKKILIVEDDAFFCELLKTPLIAAGYEIQTASDGLSGIAIALTWNPDLVFMDLDMPFMGGISSIKKLRRSNFSGKIAVLTGYPGGGNAVKSHKAGADHILIKPFQESPEILVKNILG
jgi:two-component system, OmpR family, response regulator AdeR